MGKKIWKKMLAGLMILAAFVLVACSNSGGDTSDESADSAQPEQTEETSEGLTVVATTTMLTDLIQQIGGDHVSVEGLMGPGIDPHGYNATASDVTKMNDADIVAYHGLHLEGKMNDIFAEMNENGKQTIALEDGYEQSDLLSGDETADEDVDPHTWFDVALWKKSADHVAEQLAAFDSENAEDYQANNEAYQAELDEIDEYIKGRVEEVPEKSRYLVTAHDAFNYFGHAYGFEVVGLQGMNTQTEAGTGDVSQLADFIVENEIKAIFVESSVPTRTVESLQEAVKDRGFEVSIGGELYSDALGSEEDNAETYVKMYKSNIDTIVDALK